MEMEQEDHLYTAQNFKMKIFLEDMLVRVYCLWPIVGEIQIVVNFLLLLRQLLILTVSMSFSDKLIKVWKLLDRFQRSPLIPKIDPEYQLL